jgi:dynein light chain Tctex-type 1
LFCAIWACSVVSFRFTRIQFIHECLSVSVCVCVCVLAQVVDEFFENKVFDEKMLSHWISGVCELVMEKCLFSQHHKKPFKYVVTCGIMQRTGAAVHSASSCYWDTVTDALISVVYPNRKVRDRQNITLTAIVNVFAVSIK